MTAPCLKVLCVKDRTDQPIPLGRGRFRGCLAPGGLFHARFLFGELEADLSLLEPEMSGEWAALLRNEFMQKIGLARRNQLLHLFLRNLPLQDHLANAESAGLWS